MLAKRRVLILFAALLGVLALSSPALAEPPVVSVIGGSTAPATPYAVFVQATTGGFTYSCTGSLIATQYVLTAAHCAFDQGGVQIAPGAYQVRLGSLSSASGGSLRTVTAVTVHPAFDPDTLEGDVAILKLSQVAPVATTAVIPLATDGTLYMPGQAATVFGWGITANGSMTVSPTLQMGALAVQSNATCGAVSTGIAFSPTYDLCAAAPGFNPAACHGDSGGPLVAATAGGPVEIGIVSYGSSGTCAQGPDFYTRASSMQAWATSITGGTPAPAPFVPTFAAPVTAAALAADGVAVTFTATPDPATIPTGFVATLYNAVGAAVTSQALPAAATTVTFPSLQPGSYTVGVVADYTQGASAAGVSAAVVLAPPANTVPPSVTGSGIAGSALTCQPGTWAWPGASTLTPLWLRNGASTGATTREYRVRSADAGTSIACQVALRASTGSIAVVTSTGVRALEKLAVRRRPRLTGGHAVGSTLLCSTGTWTHTGSLKLSYEWRRDGKALTGVAARRARRLIAAGDAGRRLSCHVKAKTAGQSASATSVAVRATA